MTAGVSGAADRYDAECGPHPSIAFFQSSREDEGSITEVNWTATIGFIQDVAQRFRTLQSSTYALARGADDTLKSATADAAVVETRIRDAQAKADAACQRADVAERQIELLTHNLAAAGERIDKAERRVAELSAWLRHIHHCLIDEFHNLTVAPSQSAQD